MGFFVSMSGIIGADVSAVEDALRLYAWNKEGSMEPDSLTPHEAGCLILGAGDGGCTALYPHDFFGWDEASLSLSRLMDKPVFSFHIHDGDLWMYSLYERGIQVDQFNPIPDYWQELDVEERRDWRGDAGVLSRIMPALRPERVSRYLVEWGEDVLGSTERKKAYDDDEYFYGDDWQLIDFMKRLGLDYPMDDRGVPRGKTFRFHCRSEFDVQES